MIYRLLRLKVQKERNDREIERKREGVTEGERERENETGIGRYFP